MVCFGEEVLMTSTVPSTVMKERIMLLSSSPISCSQAKAMPWSITRRF
jgi:hypothetical protein